MRLDDVLVILAAFEAEDVRYAVFGALALAAHGIDRATRDLDVFVAPDEENVSRLRRALAAVFDDLDIEEVAAGDATIKVVSPAMLYRMKRDTVRLRDRADAERLREVFGFEE